MTFWTVPSIEPSDIVPAHGGTWDRFVDAVTFVWLGVFALGIVGTRGQVLDTVLLALLPIYVVDLVVQYRRVGSFKLFLRRHWLTILMTIPYLRVLRFARLVRALRFLRVARVGRWPGIQRVEQVRRKATRVRNR